MSVLQQEHDSIFELAYNQAPIGIALLSTDGMFIKVNPAICKILGYTEQELLQLDYQSITTPEHLEMSKYHVQQLLDGSMSSFNIEKRYRLKDGSIIWASVHVSLIRNEYEDPVSFIAHIIDISDRKNTEKRLKEIEKVYGLISENAQDVISFNTPDHRCQYVSPAVRTLLGYEPEELINTWTFNLIHPDDANRLLESSSSESETYYTCRLRHKEGHYVWIEITTKYIRNEKGEIENIIAVGRDISDRLDAERTLLKSQENLAIAQEIASAGSWEWDTVKDEVQWSAQVFLIFGIREEDFVGKYANIMQMIHPDDYGFVHETIQQGNDFNVVCRIIRDHGDIKFIHIQGIVIRDTDGNIVKMYGTVQDITERIKIQKMLEESIERCASLEKYNPDGVVSLDLNGNFTSCNPAVQKITGYTPEEIHNFHFTHFIFEENVQKVTELWNQMMNGCIMESMEIGLKHKQGHRVELMVTPAPIIVQNELVGVYIIGKDISEQKRKDELLRQSEKLTVAGQLAAGVAHEIRNPLTALKGFVQLMHNGKTQNSTYLEIMKAELDRIELIVNELLMLAKPKEIDLKQTNIVQLIQSVVTLIGTQAILNNIQFQTFCELKTYVIVCDPNQIKQVFINFLKNAVEAMTMGGSVEIYIKRHQTTDMIHVRIVDHGYGIPKDKLDRLGVPFFTTKEGGTGLGFMVSKKMIENHGGKIEIYSEVNVGTTVDVFLPVQARPLL